MRNNNTLFLLSLLGMFFLGCGNEQPKEREVELAQEKAEILLPEIYVLEALKPHFEERNIEGVFVLYDVQKAEYITNNPDLLNVPFSPASTFKIFNACVILETGIADTSDWVPWDRKKRGWDKWNQDQNLGSAMKYSALWTFQEWARRVDKKDPEAYQKYLDASAYGNTQRSNPPDMFWVDHSLKISPWGQFDFLSKLYTQALPFSAETIEKVKQLIVIRKEEDYTISGKTGWAVSDSIDVGWYVGYVEKGEALYYFCTRINQPRNENAPRQNFKRNYMGLTEDILAQLLDIDAKRVD